MIHEEDSIFAHEVDHVISRQHGGEPLIENLEYACMICNRLKGADLASITIVGALVCLFNPRVDQWEEHFRLEGAIIQPLSLIGEVTTRLLQLDTAQRVVERGVGTRADVKASVRTPAKAMQP